MVSRGVMLFSSALGCYQECYSWPEKEGMGEWSTIWAGALFIWRNLLNGNMVASGNMLDTRQGYYTGCPSECYSWPEKEGMRGMIYYKSRCFIYLKELTQFIFL